MTRFFSIKALVVFCALLQAIYFSSASNVELFDSNIDTLDAEATHVSRQLKSFNIGWEQLFNSIVMDATGQYLSASIYGGGIYRSSDYGVHWSATSAPANKRWTAMTSDDTGQYLSAASYPYQIYTSSDYGNSWEYYATPFNTTTCLSASSDGQQIIATTDNHGLFKSTNAGSTWSSLSAPQYDWRAVASTSDGQLLYAASFRDGIWVSPNAGQDWSNTSAPNKTWSVIATDATGQHIYAAEGKGMWRSNNFGQYWNQSVHATLSCNAITTSSDGKYIAAIFHSGNQVIYISSNYGATWTVLTDPSVYYASFPQGLAMSSTGELIFTSTYYQGFIRSEDYGVEWTVPSYLVVDCPLFEVPFFNDYGGTYCTNPCQYPYHPRNYIPYYDSYYEPLYHCKAINLQAPLYVLILIIFAVSALYVVTITFVICTNPKIRTNYWYILIVVARTMLPTLDAVSDVLFLLTASTYNATIFALCVLLFFIHSTYFIIRDVWEDREKPHMMPCWYLCHIPDRIWNMFDKVDDIAKLFVFTLLCLPFFLINCIWMIPMSLFLFFLYSSKLYAFAVCKNTWHTLWSGNNDPVTRQVVDVSFFNEQTYYTALMCSMPQFVLQLTSAILLKNATGIVLFSLTMSLANALNTAYRSIYYRMILKMEMKDVPTVLNVLNGQEIDHRESEAVGGDLTSSLLVKGDFIDRDSTNNDRIALLKVQNEVREMKQQLAELVDIKARLAALEEGTKQRMSVLAIEEKRNNEY